VTPRLEDGAIVDEVTVDAQVTTVRYSRCPAGWQATFELRPPGTDDLTVVHRLVASTLADARSAVPGAISYLMGAPVDEPYYDEDDRIPT